MLYLHGGGYSVGSPATHRDLISRLAWSTGCRCIALDYRKAPEEPFPAALDDTLAAIRELASQDVATRTLWLGGDSAGGGLTMATLLVLRDEGAEMPAGAVLLSPWVDLTEAAMDPVPDNEHDYLFSGILERFSGDYTTQENRQDPRVSPVLGNLHGLPPLLIQAGEVEIFLPQVRRLAERARDAGVDVVLEVGEGMVHVFQAFAWFLPEARQAIHSLGLLVRARLSEEDGVVQIEAGESEPGVVKVVKVDG